MRKNKIDIISLGCSKNLVDSEHLLRQFQAAGYKVSHNADRIDGETVVVNTCGFIADAQQESIDTILQLGEAKREGKIRNLFVMGCLAERFRADLSRLCPRWTASMASLTGSGCSMIWAMPIVTTSPTSAA